MKEPGIRLHPIDRIFLLAPRVLLHLFRDRL